MTQVLVVHREGAILVMCLGVPGVVVEVKNGEAVVDFGGVRKVVDAFLVENLRPGDYVIVHAGAIIAKISEEEFKSIQEAFNELIGALKEIGGGV